MGMSVLMGGQADIVERVTGLVLQSLHPLPLATQEPRIVDVDVVEGLPAGGDQARAAKRLEPTVGGRARRGLHLLGGRFLHQ
eukprot:1896392-Pyramimonas_sp.AAC.1